MAQVRFWETSVIFLEKCTKLFRLKKRNIIFFFNSACFKTSFNFLLQVSHQMHLHVSLSKAAVLLQSKLSSLHVFQKLMEKYVYYLFIILFLCDSKSFKSLSNVLNLNMRLFQVQCPFGVTLLMRSLKSKPYTCSPGYRLWHYRITVLAKLKTELRRWVNEEYPYAAVSRQIYERSLPSSDNFAASRVICHFCSSLNMRNWNKCTSPCSIHDNKTPSCFNMVVVFQLSFTTQK